MCPDISMPMPRCCQERNSEEYKGENPPPKLSASLAEGNLFPDPKDRGQFSPQGVSSSRVERNLRTRCGAWQGAPGASPCFPPQRQQPSRGQDRRHFLRAAAGNTSPGKSSLPSVALKVTKGKKLGLRRARRSPPTQQGDVLRPLLGKTHAKCARSRGKENTSQLAGEKPGDIEKQPGMEGQDVLLGYLLFFRAACYPLHTPPAKVQAAG